MDGGSQNQSTTTQAPSWQQGYQQYGLNQSLSQYQNTPQLVAPFAPQQEQAINNISSLANGTGGSGQTSYQPPQMFAGPAQMTAPGAPPDAGSLGANVAQAGGMPGQSGQAGGGSSSSGGPWINSAQNYITNTLNGSPSSNPYLDSMFSRAANQTQPRLASEFAGAGRNVDASQGLRSQELNDLATGIYGGAYNTGVQQQENAAAMAPSILNSQLGLQNSLYGAGQNVQNLAQQYIQAPQNSLNQYLSRANGSLGQTSTFNPAFNAGAGALGGALTGSSLGQNIGNMFGGSGGDWGSLLGALGGGLLGG